MVATGMASFKNICLWNFRFQCSYSINDFVLFLFSLNSCVIDHVELSTLKSIYPARFPSRDHHVQLIKVNNRDIFTTLLNIYAGVFYKSNLMTKRRELFRQKAPSQMFDRVLNMPLNKRHSNSYWESGFQLCSWKQLL